MKSPLIALIAVALLLPATAASAQYTTYYAPTVTYSAGSSLGVPVSGSAYSTYYAPATTSYYAPATTSYYAPATTSYYAPTTSYYAPATTSYYAPAHTSYYAPATNVYSGAYSTYYAPSSGTIAYRPVTSPYVGVNAAPVAVYSPYVPGQPVRNVLRAILP